MLNPNNFTLMMFLNYPCDALYHFRRSSREGLSKAGDLNALRY